MIYIHLCKYLDLLFYVYSFRPLHTKYYLCLFLPIITNIYDNIYWHFNCFLRDLNNEVFTCLILFRLISTSMSLFNFLEVFRDLEKKKRDMYSNS